MRYGPTRRQFVSGCLHAVAALLLSALLSGDGRAAAALLVLAGTTVLLYLRQEIRLDDLGVTLLRGPLQLRLPWERITGLEPVHSDLRSRVVVRTADRSYTAAFPTDAYLARDPDFLRKAEALQAEVSRRALGGPRPAARR